MWFSQFHSKIKIFVSCFSIYDGWKVPQSKEPSCYISFTHLSGCSHLTLCPSCFCAKLVNLYFGHVHTEVKHVLWTECLNGNLAQRERANFWGVWSNDMRMFEFATADQQTAPVSHILGRSKRFHRYLQYKFGLWHFENGLWSCFRVINDHAYCICC